MIRKVDVTNYEEFQRAIKDAEGKYGKVALLVNNAGIMLLGNIMKKDPIEWQNILNVNVMGVLNGMKIVLEDMTKRNSGTIINISSVAGFKPFPNHAAYCASKYGVSALSETIRGEVANTNVRVMVVEPGAAETELLSHTTDNDIINVYNQWEENPWILNM